jgi:hypothetical protein
MCSTFESLFNMPETSHIDRRMLLRGASGLALAALAAGNHHAVQAQTPVADPVTAAAIEAYLYGYSLITSEITRIQQTNVDKIDLTLLRMPMGQFINVPAYPPADYQGITAPNADTLYSAAWLDVGEEPWLFSHPDMGDRFFLFPMYSLWMPVIDVPGTRTTGGAAKTYAITGPGWSGELPDGIQEIKSPTRYMYILGRTYCTGTKEDYEAVHQLQAQYKIQPLSTYGQDYTPVPAPVDPNPPFSMTDKVRDVINNMTVEDYFGMMADLMGSSAPPAEEDADIVGRMATFGLVPGQPFAPDDATKAAIQDAAKVGYGQIDAYQNKSGTNQNGWVIPEATGAYGTDYLARAYVAAYGYPANLSADAVYPVALTDGNGKTLNGTNTYTIHFDKGQTPPANGFWSITMYDTGYFFYPNALNKQTVSPRDNLVYNADGSLDLYFQHESPGSEKEANWLPAPAGDFILMMRLYWPKTDAPSILPPGHGTWIIPPVSKAT